MIPAADEAAARTTSSAPALPARWADDPFLLDERCWWRPAHLRTDGDALLLVQRSTSADATMLVALGPAEPLADLLRAHDDGTHRFAWVETAALDLLHAADVTRLGLVPARTGWEWMVTDTPPAAVAAEAQVRELDPVADADAIRACLADANPSTDADPEGEGERWWGVSASPHPGAGGTARSDSAARLGGTARLGGVIGASPRAGRPGGQGSAHLHGLGVRPGERGRGLGAALTAAAVRGLLADGADWVSLGMWDDNHGARRIYHRLGLRTLHRLTTLRRP